MADIASDPNSNQFRLGAAIKETAGRLWLMMIQKQEASLNSYTGMCVSTADIYPDETRSIANKYPPADASPRRTCVLGSKQPKTDTPGQEMIPRSRGYMCLKTQMRTTIVWPAVALHRPAISVVRVAAKPVACPPAIFIAPQRPINRGSLMYPSRFLKSNSKGWDESNVRIHTN
jgi:hypothetical protein